MKCLNNYQIIWWRLWLFLFKGVKRVLFLLYGSLFCVQRCRKCRFWSMFRKTKTTVPLHNHVDFARGRLRKLGDSNPRYGNPYGSLANCWFQPLTQTSGRSAYGNRTRVSAVRGPRPRPLDESAVVLLHLNLRGSWGIRTPGTVTRTAV